MSEYSKPGESSFRGIDQWGLSSMNSASSPYGSNCYNNIGPDTYYSGNSNPNSMLSLFNPDTIVPPYFSIFSTDAGGSAEAN